MDAYRSNHRSLMNALLKSNDKLRYEEYKVCLKCKGLKEEPLPKRRGRKKMYAGKNCMEPGCDRPAYCKDRCTTHYWQMKRREG